MLTFRSLVLLSAVFAALPLGAQERRVLHGVVRTAEGAPAAAANVFVVGALDGALTDSAGIFSFTTHRRDTYHLAVHRIGLADFRIDISDSAASAELLLIVRVEALATQAVVVQASRYTAGDTPGATLTPLEIVMTPGTAADVNRAIQTMPGVQQVDEGTGLYVRGGDFTETRVVLDGGLLLNPAQLQTSAGTFVGTLDPFLLDHLTFLSGGFGAQYGNALSAIADLRTQTRPTHSAATISAGLAAVDANLAIAGPRRTGLRVVVDHNDLSAMLRLNGSPRQFTTPPKGDDATISGRWDYGAAGHLSVFSTRQAAKTGVITPSPSVTDTFTTTTDDRAAVARWSDIWAAYAPSIVVSTSSQSRSDDYGSFRLESPARLTQIVGSLEHTLGATLIERTGVEMSWERFGVRGSIPSSGADQAPGARTRLYDESRRGRRFAEFDEVEWSPVQQTRVTAGLRHDDATFARASTYDPRASAAWKMGAIVSMTGAWGYYHQTVDPLLQALRADSAERSMPSMRARHAIVGLQLGEAGLLARVEVFDKRYSSLASQTPDFVTIGGGRGSARGVDVILHAASLATFDTRVVYSYVRSRRTDAATGIVAPAPADVPHNLTVIATRTLANGFSFGQTFRYASGRPFTPVLSATRDPASGTWTPRYAAPNSARLPAYARLDLSASWYRVVSPDLQVVGYVAVSNALARPNTFVRRYAADYASFEDVRSVFNRSLYFGTVVTFGRSQ